MEYYSAIPNEILPAAATWVKVIQRKTNTILSHCTWNLNLKIKRPHRYRKQMGLNEMGKGNQKVKTSSYKTSKASRCNSAWRASLITLQYTFESCPNSKS